MSDPGPSQQARERAAALAARTVNCEPSVDALAREDRLGRPLRVKLGVDPTAPDIHLGHCVVLGKLREFQDAGHTAVLVIGDWTARVGDPSGRSSTRPMLSEDEILANAETFREQAFHILDPARTEVRANGEWFAGMGLAPLFELASRATINQLLRRNDFADAACRRIARSRCSSCSTRSCRPTTRSRSTADVELGGTDQLFNLMLARDIQARYGMAQQVVMTMPILPGTDGVQKMSKSLGNYIGVTDAPEEQFGKVMSIPGRAAGGVLPADVSGRAGARRATPATRSAGSGGSWSRAFTTPGAAAAAEEHFNRVVRDREAPADVPEFALAGRRDPPAGAAGRRPRRGLAQRGPAADPAGGRGPRRRAGQRARHACIRPAWAGIAGRQAPLRPAGLNRLEKGHPAALDMVVSEEHHLQADRGGTPNRAGQSLETSHD